VSHDELMRSFRSAWGIAVDRNPKTVEGVLELAEAAEKDRSLMTDLVAAADSLCDPTAKELDSLLFELERSGRLDPGLLKEMEGVADAHQLMLDGVEELADPEGIFEDALDWLREAVPKHQMHQNNIFLWKKKPACPLCSFRSTTSRSCQGCGVHLVIPDLEPPDMPSVILAQTYLDLRLVAGAVATGKKPLSAFKAAIANLTSELSKLQRLLAQIPEGAYDTSELLIEAERVFLGIKRMQQFEESCAIADLNHGWVMVSKAGVRLRKLTDDLTASLS
jgi:hypothetical protein